MPSWPQSQRSSELRLAIKAAYRRDENETLRQLQAQDPLQQHDWESAQRMARELIAHLRQCKPANHIEPLLSEFRLATVEGAALMSLTEALLRVPDEHTSRQLIADKLLAGDWSRHRGRQRPLAVNCAALGLSLAKRILKAGGAGQWQYSGAEAGGAIRAAFRSVSSGLVSRMVRAVIHTLGTEFVQGKSIAEALQRARAEHGQSDCFSFDMLGEGARTQAAAKRYFEKYREAIDAVGAARKSDPQRQNSVSVKLSALHPRYEYNQKNRLMTELAPRLMALALQAKQRDIHLTVDAEEARRLELSLDIIEVVFRDQRLDGWDGFGFAVQAYQKRAVAVVNWALQLARDCDRPLNLRLVKGAYWDSEIKWSQQGGYQDYPVFTEKAGTDLSYLVCANILLRQRQQLRPQFATHNAATVAAVIALDEAICDAAGGDLSAKSGYEFQRLYGMGVNLHRRVQQRFGLPCRVYAPVGEHKELLPYLVRRMLENGANSSFVHQLSTAAEPVDELLQQLLPGPLQRSSRIPLPRDILRRSNGAHFCEENSTLETSRRENSSGLELVDDLARQRLDQLLQEWQEWRSPAAAAVESGITETENIEADDTETKSIEGEITETCSIETDCTESDDSEISKETAPLAVFNPADRNQRVGQVNRDSAPRMLAKLQTTAAAFPNWSSTPATRRAAILRACADHLLQQREELIVLLVKESGKTLLDSDAEVREAVDFCRYYADQAEALFAAGAEPATTAKRLHSRGVAFCISPWNFPLAIFLGQIAAALAAGNTVIAKPADQTCLIASKTRQLLIEAGLPEDALQLILARGKLAGETLIGQPEVQAVVFTGSIATARWLAQRLARRESEVALIAETGGQNAMIVDATALPEQVVDDVLQSAFQSAGQRCSALRVLYLQQEVAEDIIQLLQQAMAELTIGDPALLATDVGPVIDATAVAGLRQHQHYLQGLGNQVKLLQQLELPASCAGGSFFAPCLYEIPSIKLLPGEVFGPILHVVRYAADALPQVIDDINSTGFGLTMGIHSRIERRGAAIAEQVRAGNIYLNRNMIGAVVGVQPFGGQGLSGTGPKAGGPHYLGRLLTSSPALCNQDSSNKDSSNKDSNKGINKSSNSRVLENDVPLLPARASAELLEQLPPPSDFISRLDREARYQLGARACSLFPAPRASALRDLLATIQQSWWPVTRLPGPVGEVNTLQYQARGLLVQILAEEAEEEHELLLLWGSLLTGNSVAVLAPPTRMAEASAWLQHFTAAGFPSGLVALLPLATSLPVLRCAGLSGVVISAISPYLPTVKACLLEHHQALLPVITETQPSEFLPRLILEKTISVNSAALGGITELLADSKEPKADVALD
ncbi:MAG: bifunctional proline dehydrogenase/L-glutamate gamma-semialdehyde dehydrogenase PutA [Gammaproteobacteria bacterium]|nr:bifunctional proline dehydrogenase/L-glutamate gamma-semialdehyde dehydrogenase PutA [Gammaproteobacteria bacterium]